MNDMKKNDPLRQHLVNLLTKAEAHVDLESSIKDFPVKLRGARPEGSPHTPWQLLEHIRIAQWDILEFSKSGKHKSLKWPDDYWPKTEAPPDEKAWDKSVKQIHADLKEISGLVGDPENDLVCTKYYTYWSIIHGLISINIVRKGASDEINRQILKDAITGITRTLTA